MSVETRITRLAIDTIRTLAMDAVEKAASGHPGTPMALAPVPYVIAAQAEGAPRHFGDRLLTMHPVGKPVAR